MGGWQDVQQQAIEGQWGTSRGQLTRCGRLMRNGCVAGCAAGD